MAESVFNPGDPSVITFFCKRLIDDAGDRGMSSDAMIALAIAYGGIPADYKGPHPHDTADLARCCEAFSLAPWRLRRRMLPILAQWSADLIAKDEASHAA